jgi:hypothetical protein
MAAAPERAAPRRAKRIIWTDPEPRRDGASSSLRLVSFPVNRSREMASRPTKMFTLAAASMEREMPRRWIRKKPAVREPRTAPKLLME